MALLTKSTMSGPAALLRDPKYEGRPDPSCLVLWGAGSAVRLRFVRSPGKPTQNKTNIRKSNFEKFSGETLGADLAQSKYNAAVVRAAQVHDTALVLTSCSCAMPHVVRATEAPHKI